MFQMYETVHISYKDRLVLTLGCIHYCLSRIDLNSNFRGGGYYLKNKWVINKF